MRIFIAAIPLFDATMTVGAYYLRDQSGDRALSVKHDFRGRDEALLSPGLDLIEKIGVEPFAGDMPLFVEINKYQLLKGAPANMDIPKSKLVCLIPGSLPVDADALTHCRALQSQGYTLALDNFPLSGLQSEYLDCAGYVMLNYNDPRLLDILKALGTNRPQIHTIIANIPNMAAYDELRKQKTTDKSLFSGNFYRQPITQGISKISPIKVNALQLLKNVNESDFELDEITKIIERDPALSISLLRFINSGALNISRKIESIQSAVAILGQQEVRRWATVAISVSLADDRPGEITKLTLVRAKFAEGLAGTFEMGVFQNQLFMAGLFSLLDVILQKPMDQAIQEVAVDQRVHDALVLHKGDLYKVLEFIFAYEHADWDQASILMIRNNIDIEAVNKAFVDALTWYNQLLLSIDENAAVESPA